MEKLNKKKIAESPELAALADDLDQITAIAVVAESEGGELIVKNLMADVVLSIDILAMRHSTMDIKEFVAIGASIKTKLDTIRAIKRAPSGKEEIKKMLEEALQE